MIINSLLDTDIYNLYIQQLVFHQFKGTPVTYKFKCRNKVIGGEVAIESFVEKIREEVGHLCGLHFTPEDISYLRDQGVFKEDYLNYLKSFKLNRFNIYIDWDSNDLVIGIEGAWEKTVLFETPVLAIISELYAREVGNACEATENFGKKYRWLRDNAPKGFKFTDFGTRRRFSFAIHRAMLKTLKTFLPDILAGTSNAHFARVLDIPVVGTQAHQYFQAHQQLTGKLRHFQLEALWNWQHEYKGKLGIALSDTVGFDAFLEDFRYILANKYDGCRHDSGDPYKWGHKLIDHYIVYGINPKTKTAVFSDGLTMESAIDLYNHFKPFIKTAFGIGTSFTNDADFEPLQIVIKMVSCNNRPTAKISD